ncbi:MAG: YHYH protein [Cyanobacteria bacterium SID2]|nr:YHYH protein [Cyanobacteria bacterium SID2]MBP0004793.1 YHYH protein [Cyanobacteria bacterium SBC]
MTFAEIIPGAEFDFAIATVESDIITFANLSTDLVSQLQASGGVDAVVLLGGDDTATDDDSGRIYFGNAGNDTLSGLGGSDTMASGQNDDIVFGGNDGDILFGNLNADRLYGDDGDDLIFGGQDNDIVVGDGGNDLVSGDRGDDTLRGGDGTDTLTGGGGSDRFLLEVNRGTDTITDFEPLADAMQLPNAVTVNDIQIQALSDTQTAIALGNTTLAILENVSASEITGANFVTTGLFRDSASVTFTDTAMVVTSTAIPTHPTGAFPDFSDSNSDGQPDNPTAISPQNLQFSIPLTPTVDDTPTDVNSLPTGAIGIAINGVPFYGPFNDSGQNAVDTEVFDFANGHPDAQGVYHYHQNPILLQQQIGGSSVNRIIGYAFDGYPIYGINGEDGQPPTDLDQFNGHEGPDGTYHYHITENFPYILGGYRGVVS